MTATPQIYLVVTLSKGYLKIFSSKNAQRIAAHLESIEFNVSLVTTEWFLCLFSKSLPSETTLRVWDVLFYEGAKVLFHVALAIFKMKEEELVLAYQVGDVINILQKTTHHLSKISIISIIHENVMNF